MRLYDCPDGSKVPSVTTILDIIGDKSIMSWANYLGFKHIKYEDELERLAKVGTKMHNILQNHIDPTSNIEIDYSSIFEKHECELKLNRFKELMKSYDYKTILTEETMISPTLGYGGTLDWYVEINNHRLIIDFKSSSKVKLKQILQIGGYTNLCKERGIRVDGGGILLVNKNICSLYLLSSQKLDNLGEVFTKIKDTYSLVNNISLVPEDIDILK